LTRERQEESAPPEKKKREWKWVAVAEVTEFWTVNSDSSIKYLGIKKFSRHCIGKLQVSMKLKNTEPEGTGHSIFGFEVRDTIPHRSTVKWPPIYTSQRGDRETGRK